MEPHRKLLLANKAWRTEMTEIRSDYFQRLAEGQKPSCLWIGCSDSRVPAEEITGARPGEIFVHRNVANLVHHDDNNLLSVVDFAVNILEIGHIIICGHCGCGGIRAALLEQSSKIIGKWIKPITSAMRSNQAELDSIADQEGKVNFLAKMNVRNQVVALSKTEVIQNAWRSKRSPLIHGWIFDLEDGRLSEVCSIDPLDFETGEESSSPLRDGTKADCYSDLLP